MNAVCLLTLQVAEFSVAIAQADVFSINGYSVPNKIAKSLEIFYGVEEPKS